jgi:hypothetical protein
MSGQPPWQGPDGRWYTSGQRPVPGTPPPPSRQPGRPPEEEPKKKPWTDSAPKWLSTTGGLISAGAAVAALLIGGTVVTVKVITSSPTVTPSQSSSLGPTSPSPPAPNPAPSNLKSALLSPDVLGSAALVESQGTDLSKLGGICNVPWSGATAIAYEGVQNNQTGTFLGETLVSWPTVQDASNSIAADRKAIDQRESCSDVVSGSTETFTSDYPGSPPPSCINPGQYFASSVETTSPSAVLPYQGFFVEAQCGTITISVKEELNLPGASQQTADGYLGSAISKLDTATS